MHILLVEATYCTRYPPSGLLKLASYHRVKGDSVELIRGCSFPDRKPDKVYVISLFTWGWKEIWEAVRYYKGLFSIAEICLGGIYASLMPRSTQKCQEPLQIASTVVPIAVSSYFMSSSLSNTFTA